MRQSAPDSRRRPRGRSRPTMTRGRASSVPTNPDAHRWTRCTECSLRSICLPFDLPRLEHERLSSAITSRRRLGPGEALYGAGDKLAAVYAVRSGFFKTSVISEDGREQVTSFPMAGDIVGLDGIGDEHGASRAVALAESEVCIISLLSLMRLGREDQPIQHQFSRVLGREIGRHQSVMTMLGSMCAEKRLAAFLLNLSRSWLARGFSPSDFQLPMTREDIGSYLGIKLETVSRALVKLHTRGLIDANRRHVEIRDLDGLAKLVGR